MGSENIIRTIEKAGIIGAGGGGFPTHLKLSKKAKIVIANGAECEPLLKTDLYLMQKEPENIITGLKLTMEATGAKEGIIALKAKHADIIKTFDTLLEKEANIKIYPLSDFYPAGDEHVLVYETTNRLIPMGGLPIDQGVVVNNVYTLALIANALEGLNFTHRYITITGCVNRPCVVKVPVGTTIEFVIKEAAKGTTEEKYRVITGGPMMGSMAESLNMPITKTTGGVIVLPENHKLIQQKLAPIEHTVKKAKSACCQCTFCTDLCPRFLLGHEIKPHKTMNLLPGAIESLKDIYTTVLCTDCGLCTYYACTMGLAPNMLNTYIKKLLTQNNIKAGIDKTKELMPHPLRDYRKVPASRLTERLGLGDYEKGTVFMDETFIPDKIILPLKQHTGKSSIPVVKKGDRVKTGDLIAKIPENSLGANIHTGIEGIVEDVNSLSMTIKAW